MNTTVDNIVEEHSKYVKKKKNPKIVFFQKKKTIKIHVNPQKNDSSKVDMNLSKMSKDDLKSILVKKNLIKKDSKAPLNILKMIYRNSLIGGINSIKN